MAEFRSFATILESRPQAANVEPLVLHVATVPSSTAADAAVAAAPHELEPAFAPPAFAGEMPAAAFVEPPTPPPIALREVDAPPAAVTSPQLAAMLANFAAEIVRLRARAAELVESESESMLQMMASRVLVRELEIKPADVAELARRVRAEWSGAHPLRFRVAAADVALLEPLGEALEVDPALHPGDLQVELPEGILDLRLGTRLAAVLDSHRIAV